MKNKTNTPYPECNCPVHKKCEHSRNHCVSEEGWESYVDKWSKQGRGEDQIWAVRNFMTGQGSLMLKDLLSSQLDSLKGRIEGRRRRN